MPTPGPDPEPTDVERRLARLKPPAVALDRDRMLYEAGRAAGIADSRDRLGLATAGLTAVAVVLGGLLVRERGERRATDIVAAGVAGQALPVASPIVPPPRPIEPDSYLAFRRQILAGRLDPAAGGVVLTAPAGPGDSPGPLRVRGRIADL